MSTLNGEFQKVAKGVKLQPMQRRMLDLLSDGAPHTATELHSFLMDDLGPISNIVGPIHFIRRAIAKHGYGIVAIRDQGETVYRIVKFLS